MLCRSCRGLQNVQQRAESPWKYEVPAYRVTRSSLLQAALYLQQRGLATSKYCANEQGADGYDDILYYTKHHRDSHSHGDAVTSRALALAETRNEQRCVSGW